MNPIKVTTAVEYPKAILCKGKLVFVTRVCERHKNLTTNVDARCTCGVDKIIISETEDVKVGDKCYDAKFKQIVRCKDESDAIICNINREEIGYYKIIAFHENISPELFKFIAERKLKNGAEVYLECNRFYFEHEKFGEENHCGNCAREWDLNYLNQIKCREKEGEFEIKLTDGFISLFVINKDYDERYFIPPAEAKTETWDEIYDEFYEKFKTKDAFEFLLVLKKNYAPPNRKD